MGLNVIEREYKSSLPKIQLPERAHNTIGEIPLIEHYDDGRIERINPERNWGKIRTHGTMLTSMDFVYSQDRIIYSTVSADGVSFQ
jgi:hypothetical protein